LGVGSPAYALPGSWTFYEWQPRQSTGVAGYTGGQGADGTVYIQNTGEFGSSAWYSAEPLPAKAYTIYDLSVRVRAQDATAGSVNINIQGPNLSRVFPLKKGSYPSTTQTFSFITPAGTTGVRVYLENGGGGTLWFEDATLREVPFSSRTTMVRGDTRFLYTPRASDMDPPLASSERARHEARGYILYRRSDPRLVYPESIPQPEEITSVLSASVAPGQQAGLWFSVYGLAHATDVSVEVAEDFVAEGGGRIPRQAMEVRLIRFWPQRTTWSSTNYYVIPELLEPLADLGEPVPLSSGKSQGFWIHVKVPNQASAGSYRSKLTVRPAGRAATDLALELEVLPFELEDPPGINWVLDSNLRERTAGGFSDDALATYLAEIRSHGITGLVDSIYYRDNAGKLSFDLARRTAPLIKNAGFPGPLVLFGGVHYKALETLGIPQPSGWSFMTYNAVLESEGVQAAYRDELGSLDSIVRGAGIADWYYYLVDEPSTPDRLPLAIWESKNAKRAGVKSYATLYPLYELPKLLPSLDVVSSSFITASETRNQQYRTVTDQHGTSMWHLGAGSYTGQEGGLMPNRYQAGFLFYKSGAKSEVSWTYQVIKGQPFDDFDGTGSEPKDACIVYPARNPTAGGRTTLSTLQWEGIREGIDDYKYLHTLKQWISRALQSGHQDAAASAQATLDSILSPMPWLGAWNVGESYSTPGNFSNESADQARQAMAREIVKLKALVEPPGSGAGSNTNPEAESVKALAQGCGCRVGGAGADGGLIAFAVLAIVLRLKARSRIFGLAGRERP
jgi:hypothetical protein